MYRNSSNVKLGFIGALVACGRWAIISSRYLVYNRKRHGKDLCRIEGVELCSGEMKWEKGRNWSGEQRPEREN